MPADGQIAESPPMGGSLVFEGRRKAGRLNGWRTVRQREEEEVRTTVVMGILPHTPL